jgi:hypothetical protein|tara:strand:- start:358 stop:771 length:414 start_codon:yes stop_codon:yes gene_type:complete
MYVSDLGFTFYDNKFEDGAEVEGELAYRSFSPSFPSISPRPRLLCSLVLSEEKDEKSPPYSLLFHLRIEAIKKALWKTTPKRTKSPSASKAKLRKQILNCPPEQMLELLKAHALLNDEEPIPSATKLKPVLPSLNQM